MVEAISSSVVSSPKTKYLSVKTRHHVTRVSGNLQACGIDPTQDHPLDSEFSPSTIFKSFELNFVSFKNKIKSQTIWTDRKDHY